MPRHYYLARYPYGLNAVHANTGEPIRQIVVYNSLARLNEMVALDPTPRIRVHRRNISADEARSAYDEYGLPCPISLLR